jgi:magnesium-transporting ATPase (P-type)
MTLGLVLVVLTTHMLFGRPVLESLMFAVALAVGLTPELLPMITTVTLSRGALRMAARKVIVKRLASFHDLGAMTVLCTDKTGTLTSAEITLARSLNPSVEDARRPARRDCGDGRRRRALTPPRSEPACAGLDARADMPSTSIAGSDRWRSAPKAIADRQGRAGSDVGALHVAP